MAEIAVLIPHFNAIEALKKSIFSIDEDIDVDILIVDDGSSTKPKREDFKFYKYGKVSIIGFVKNRGIEHALNFGLKEIQKRNYSYVGRLDCADTCAKNRFTKQIKFLKANNNIYLLGSWVKFKDTNNRLLYTFEPPENHKRIRKKSFLNAMFIHPTVCFRLEILESIGYYPIDCPAAEDFAFFFKILNKYETANYPEYLVNVEIDPDGISGTKRKIQVKSRIQVVLDNFYFGFYPIYGLIRNLLLLFVSQKITTALKKAIYNK